MKIRDIRNVVYLLKRQTARLHRLSTHFGAVEKCKSHDCAEAFAAIAALETVTTRREKVR